MTYETLNNLAVLVFSACWGSFLNVIAYRLLHNVYFWLPRSRCPACKRIIPFYDLIPILSWVLLVGRCRQCNSHIAWLYPFIELVTIIVFWIIYSTQESIFWPAYALLCSSLIITIRTDIEGFVIFRFFTLGIIPFAFIFSYYGMLPLTIQQSMAGAMLGFMALSSVRWGSYALTGSFGMGNGDPELLATVGAFLGPFLCWWTLIIASTIGSFWGLTLIAIKGHSARKKPIPFGPFIAAGAVIVLAISENIEQVVFLLTSKFN